MKMPNSSKFQVLLRYISKTIAHQHILHQIMRNKAAVMNRPVLLKNQPPTTVQALQKIGMLFSILTIHMLQNMYH